MASTMDSGSINLRSNRSREAEHSLICGAAGLKVPPPDRIYGCKLPVKVGEL